MMSNFPFILVCLTLISGAICLVDCLCFAKKRKASDGSETVMPKIAEYAKSFFPVFLIVLIIRSFLGQIYTVPTGSLEPTVIPGDFVLVNQFAYGLRLPVWGQQLLHIGEPKRGDIVVFHWPVNPKIDFIKRVIGLPGDRITYIDNVLTINGQKANLTFEKATTDSVDGQHTWKVDQLNENLLGVKHSIYNCPKSSNNCPVGKPMNFLNLKVPQGEYFMMGDNRANSDDSRDWGFVPEKNLVGKGEFLLLSWDKNASWAHKIRWHRIGNRFATSS